MIELLTLALGTGIGLYVMQRQHRAHEAERVLVRAMLSKRPRPLLCRIADGQISLQAVGNKQPLLNKVRFIISITHHEIIFQPLPAADHPPVDFTPDQLRWFGRPEKYGPYRNDLWMHFERGGMWYLVQLHLPYMETVRVVRALKEVAEKPLVKAYRRQRPYVHFGPSSVYSAHQDIYGAWLLDQPFSLYVMPAKLVIFSGEAVSRVIKMEDITHVQVIERADGPGSIVTFQTRREKMSYAFERNGQPFATALAEAARRWLDEPLETIRRKRKDK